MWRPTSVTDPRELAARRAARWVTIAATALFTMMVCGWQPWHLFARAGFSSDFYDEQARSFVRGRLSVRPEVAGIEGFVVDGATYFYYGPFLAIMRLPFALFGDTFAGRLTRLSLVLAFVTWCTASFHLAGAARRWAAERWVVPVAMVASPWRTAAFVAAAATSPALFMPGWISVYHETELWAATFALWAAVGAVRLSLEPSRRAAWLTAAAVAAAVTTRASVGLGAAIGAGLVALMLWRRERAAASVVLGGAVAGVAVQAAVNWARFGSPTKLPAELQVLTAVDPERAAWFAGNGGSFFSLRFLPTTLTQYLRPDSVRFERLVPFLRYGPLARDHGSYPVETITPAASITNAAPLLCVAAVIGVVMIVRRRDLVWGSLVVGAAVAAVPTLTIGFIAHRYLVDLLPLLLVAGAMAFAAVTLPAEQRALHRWARIGVVALLVWSAWCNAALATWSLHLKDPSFTSLRYRVDEVFFGDPAPSLVAIDATSPVPRDGVVGIASGADGQCDAVYIAEQRAWVPLERLDGSRQVTAGDVTIDPAGRTLVAGGDTWDVWLEVDDTSMRVVLDDGGIETVGEPLPLPGGELAVRIVNDDIVDQFSVTVLDGGDERLGLFRFGALPGPTLVSTSPGSDAAQPADETLCRRLEHRL